MLGWVKRLRRRVQGKGEEELIPHLTLEEEGDAAYHRARDQGKSNELAAAIRGETMLYIETYSAVLSVTNLPWLAAWVGATMAAAKARTAEDAPDGLGERWGARKYAEHAEATARQRGEPSIQPLLQEFGAINVHRYAKAFADVYYEANEVEGVAPAAAAAKALSEEAVGAKALSQLDTGEVVGEEEKQEEAESADEFNSRHAEWEGDDALSRFGGKR